MGKNLDFNGGNQNVMKKKGMVAGDIYIYFLALFDCILQSQFNM